MKPYSAPNAGNPSLASKTAMIQDYLSDETKLYQAWYTDLTQSGGDTFTTPVSVIPELSELKQLFEKWIYSKQSILSSKLCETYCTHKQTYKNTEPVLIAAIADILTVLFTGAPINTVAVAVILCTENYLNHMCKCEKYVTPAE